ncbi:MAG: YebC/PmpR family DNA-binding transcriptional regulator, partial [Thermomicrobiales bacterium]
EGAADNFDEIWYEGYGPGGAALMIQAMTDNRNRTVGEVRAVLTRAGGALGETGSVGWMFDQVGLIELEPNGTDPDDLALLAIDAGASDVGVEEEAVEVFTEPHDLHKVREALLTGGFKITSAQLTMRPKTTLSPEMEQALKTFRLVEKLEELDDVQEVFTNVDVPSEMLAGAAP